MRFACTGARPEPFAAGPSLLFDLRIADDSGRRVHSIALRTQFRIEPRQRPYAPEEQARLVDLFGEPARWGETLNPLQLATVGSALAGFTGETTAVITVPLTYDLDIAATKYCHGLADGEIPLLLLFAGTVYYQGDTGVQVEQQRRAGREGLGPRPRAREPHARAPSRGPAAPRSRRRSPSTPRCRRRSRASAA